MQSLLDAPPEILEQILLELDPLDVSSVSQTCTALHDHIYDPSNELLWRDLYLSMPLDDPRRCFDPLGNPIKHEDIHWRESLQRIIRARTVVRRPELGSSQEERLAIAQTLLELASHTVPLDNLASDDISLNLVWVGSMLREGTFFEQSRWDVSKQELRLRARLHTIYGLTLEDFKHQERVESLCTVYTMRNYSDQNDYGPFINDGTGRVDWTIVRSIQHLISLHFIPRPQTSTGENATMKEPYIPSPMSLPFCCSVLDSIEVSLDDVDDWAGVEGDWRYAFCFCDHRKLLAFNNYPYPDGSLRRGRGVFEDADFTEAFNPLELSLHITDAEYDEDHPTRPIIHFKGISKADETDVEGTVRISSEGHIKWQFVSDDTWSCQGVQVGNIRSVYGVLGIWTTTQHEQSDPVGPFWLHKAIGSPPWVLGV
ncbi:hypothetical protein BDY19DRAFT_957399 [Irpex rosettiformis]|uniref:Uncharacterized protein n=1 Tax=Irpex rosettiformis TaxID=378272 RepID=A0ACB8TXZ0_9APHY|nr:hypothetical protein BDY19DRAFT_957399 [Irpex rosettiformis]